MGKFIERKEAQKTSAEMKKLKKETMAKYFQGNRTKISIKICFVA